MSAPAPPLGPRETALSVPCPYCGSVPGAPCVSLSGAVRSIPHSGRYATSRPATAPAAEVDAATHLLRDPANAERLADALHDAMGLRPPVPAGAPPDCPVCLLSEHRAVRPAVATVRRVRVCIDHADLNLITDLQVLLYDRRGHER